MVFCLNPFLTPFDADQDRSRDSVLQRFCLTEILSYRDSVLQRFCLTEILSYRDSVLQRFCLTEILSYVERTALEEVKKLILKSQPIV